MSTGQQEPPEPAFVEVSCEKLRDSYLEIVSNHKARIPSPPTTKRDEKVLEFCLQHSDPLHYEDAAILSKLLGEKSLNRDFLIHKFSKECGGLDKRKKLKKATSSTSFDKFELLVTLLCVRPEKILADSDRAALRYCEAQSRKKNSTYSSLVAPETRPDALHWLPPRFPLLCRESEAQAVTELVLAPNSRPINITGTFGVGTSHLAIAVLERLRTEKNWQVAFVPVGDKATVPEFVSTIARALNISRLDVTKGSTQKRREPDELSRAIEAYLRNAVRSNGPVALVLDDFSGNQLLADETFLAWLAKIKGLKVLLTTRSRIILQSQVRYDLPHFPYPKNREWESLPVPELEQMPSYALFATVARRGDFQCEKLDASGKRSIAHVLSKTGGLPSYICSAAAAAKPWTSAKDLERLFTSESRGKIRDATPSPSQWEIYEKIISNWSDQDLRILRGLAMFPAPFQRSDAKAVLDTDDHAFERAWERAYTVYFIEQASEPGKTDTGAEGTWSLVSPVRDWLLDWWSSHANDPTASGLQRGYVTHYVAKAGALSKDSPGPNRARIVVELNALREHIVEAMEFALRHRDFSSAAEGLLSLEESLTLQGLGQTSLAYASRLLAVGTSLEPCVHARLLKCCARAHFSNGNFRRAGEFSHRAIEEAEKCVDPTTLADCLRRHTDIVPQKASNEFHREQLGMLDKAKAIYVKANNTRARLCGGAIHWDWLGDPQKAISAANEALDYAKSHGDPFEIALRYRTLGQILWRDGQPSEGLECFDLALGVLPKEIHSPNLVGSLKTNRGLALSDIGKRESDAEAAFTDGFRLLKEADNETWQHTNLIGQARLLLRQGQFKKSRAFVDTHLARATLGSSDNEILLRVVKGVAFTKDNCFTEAKELLLDANELQRNRSSLNTLRCFCSTVALAKCHFELGELAEARSQVAAAKEIAAARNISDKYSVPYIKNTHILLQEIATRLESSIHSKQP